MFTPAALNVLPEFLLIDLLLHHFPHFHLTALHYPHNVNSLSPVCQIEAPALLTGNFPADNQFANHAVDFN